VKLGEVLFARSIEPFEGGRWRLRWTRANGYGRSYVRSASFLNAPVYFIIRLNTPAVPIRIPPTVNP